MPKKTTCKVQDCPRKRFQLRTLCLFHIRERERAKKAEKAAKKKARRLNSKGYQESQRKILIKKLDIVFSKLIRSADACLYCGKTSAQAQLHCSHVYSRKNLATRWDEMNAKCLCSYHHRRWWHEQPAEAFQWLTEKWGEEHMAELKRRANSVWHWQDHELRELLASLTAKLSQLSEPDINPLK